MTPHQFIAKWHPTNLPERASAQEHFLDLCELLEHPKPAEADPSGKYFRFEKGVDTSDGHKGWADVWYDQHFGWEYKGKHKDLRAAYQQLLKYREALNNPPLLIVCDLNKFEMLGSALAIREPDAYGLTLDKLGVQFVMVSADFQ
jgi:hypothetical protein